MTTSNITRNRIKQYLAEGKRFDGRSPVEFRDLVIEKNISKNAEGSVKVKLGKTEVLVGVKMDISTPYPDSPNKGNLMVSAELSPISSSRFESGPPKFPAIELGRVLDRMVRESKYIDLEKLCVEEGEKVWTVFIDVYSLNDAGNLLDAAGIGIIAALQISKIPKYDKEKEKVLFGEWTDEKLPVSENAPLTLTVHKIGDYFIVDPTTEEEDISETRITIGSFNGNISSMQKGNKGTLTIDEMNKVLEINEKVWKSLSKKFEEAMKK